MLSESICGSDNRLIDYRCKAQVQLYRQGTLGYGLWKVGNTTNRESLPNTIRTNQLSLTGHAQVCAAIDPRPKGPAEPLC